MKESEKYYDIWTYHKGAGWWLNESGVCGINEAIKIFDAAMKGDGIIAGAFVPHGEPLGLFTKNKRG